MKYEIKKFDKIHKAVEALKDIGNQSRYWNVDLIDGKWARIEEKKGVPAFSMILLYYQPKPVYFPYPLDTAQEFLECEGYEIWSFIAGTERVVRAFENSSNKIDPDWLTFGLSCSVFLDEGVWKKEKDLLNYLPKAHQKRLQLEL